MKLVDDDDDDNISASASGDYQSVWMAHWTSKQQQTHEATNSSFQDISSSPINNHTTCALLDPSIITRPDHHHHHHHKFPHFTHLHFSQTNLRIAANLDSSSGNAYLSSSAPFVSHGVKIQSLATSHNASSAETDALDMDAFTQSSSGVNHSSFNKALNSKPRKFSGVKSGTYTGNTYRSSELPNTNLELSAANNTTGGAVPSSSKTQSLDMDMLLAYPARTNNSISGPCQNMLPKTDTTGRWAKRLKSSASDTQGFGTRVFDLEDVSRNKMKRASDMFTSEILGDKPKEKLTETDKTKAFQINDVTSSEQGRKTGKDLLLSQSWIQRWLRNQAGTPEKQSEALVLCEPQSSKLVLDDLHKKQFPSIAAMALMGKAMNGFQPCELQNRGTFVVWN